jgi:hypothetical protein
MDISSGFDLPNPYGLLASDFSYDTEGYRVALAFLGDLATGSDHDHALTNNGGNPAMLRAWQGGEKFRRVYAKCRAAGEREKAALAAQEATRDEQGASEGETQGQRFIPLEEAPVRRGVFTLSPPRESWGVGWPE